MRSIYRRGISFKVLKKAWNEATKDYEREHVTSYIIENQEKFKLLNVTNDADLNHLRWTLDTEEDFEFINAVYERIYSKKHLFLMDDVLELLDKESELIDINRHIEQKAIHQRYYEN